jgi:hypothetical protein
VSSSLAGRATSPVRSESGSLARVRRRVALLIGQIVALALSLPLAVVTALYATGNAFVAFLAPIVIYGGILYLILRPVPRLVAELYWADSETRPER